MTPNLRSAQSLFQQHMLGQADAGGLLAGSAARRTVGLGIYANAYRRRLVEALADAYAKTRGWLGEECFDRVALAYVERQPPRTRYLRWYGADFADQLPSGLSARAAAAELARLDWALRTAFDGPDSDVMTLGDLAGIAPQEWKMVRLRVVPTAQLLSFGFNTVAVWQAIDDGVPPPRSARSDAAIAWLVWRKDLQPHFRSLDANEASLLHALLAGAVFADACAEAQAADQGFGAEQIGGCLRQWLDDGVIAQLPAAAGA